MSLRSVFLPHSKAIRRMMIVDICEEIEKNDKSNKQKIFLLTKDNDDRFGGSDISFSEIAEFFFGFSTEREYTKDRIL